MSHVAEETRVQPDPLALTVCPECGYSLESLPSEGICPECGEKYDQRFIVLFGETPEGLSRKSERWIMIVIAAFATFIVYSSARRGQLMTRSIFVIACYLAVFLLLWILRRLSLKKEILFQVWMNERGYAVRRPKSESTVLPRIFAAWRRAAVYMVMLGGMFDDSRSVSVWFVLALLLMAVIFTGLHVVMSGPTRRRRVKTGDARQPTLTGWAASDTVDVDPAGSNAARVRIKSRSYLGQWKWHEWNGLDAVVRVNYEQMTALRQRIEAWLSAQLRAPIPEVSSNA